MDAFRVLQLMGGVSGVRLALKANRVDGSGADPQGRAATKIRELLTWAILRMEGKTYDDQQVARVA